jgi:hypothetical protein
MRAGAARAGAVLHAVRPADAGERSDRRQGGRPRVSAAVATPKGWGAKSIESAYRLPVTRGAGQTIAMVDAMSTPHLASDLGVYRKHYGLPPAPPPAGCLQIVNQEGQRVKDGRKQRLEQDFALRVIAVDS